MKKHEDKNLQQEIADLQEKVADLTAGWQRTQADFVNYKKQTAEDRAYLIKCANDDLITSLLPVLDNFQLAAKHLPDNLANDNWAQGIAQIEKQFEAILAESGLTRIESLGQHFDPELHEAIEEVEAEADPGTVVEEVLAGYRYHDNVLRPSKVKVAK